MIVATGYGNCYVIGRSNDNYLLIGLRRNGTHRITPVTPVPDQGLALTMAGAGLVHLTGESTGSGTALDYVTLANSQDIDSSTPTYDYVEVGTEASGDLEDLEDSDNSYKVYTRYSEDIATEVLVIEYEGTSAISYANHPSELTVRIEGKCSVGPVTMKVELWNAVTSQYDDFGTLPVTTSDSERVIVVKDDPLAYINSSSSMAIRLSFLETVGQSTLWTYSVDRIVWEVLED
ncbi:MAG TPA: hypothetical protein PKA27_17415 [Fimbriimonadaceae bacterium]|nr:hypothetical protein [Fimbriimonadaceae bacterium]